MRTRLRHRETHRTDRIGWLRAAVLGANDGIVSTASLLVGVAAAGTSQPVLMITGVAAVVGGAMSMAAGEYVSVHSQADTERADVARESAELQANPDGERQELAAIYVQRGLTPPLADEVAAQLMAHDALGAHRRDELGLSEQTAARPLQAAMSSAASFAAGAALPLAVAVLGPPRQLVAAVSVTSLCFLAALGAAAARAGGAPAAQGAWRVTFWGAAAMGVTAAVGRLFGVTVG